MILVPLLLRTVAIATVVGVNKGDLELHNNTNVPQERRFAIIEQIFPAFSKLKPILDQQQPQQQQTQNILQTYNSSLETTVQLTITNRTVHCSITNLPPNTNYMVNYYRDNVQFAFYRVREPEVIFSTTNLDRIHDFYPSQVKGPNFSVGLSSDSNPYGSYQCSVETLGPEDDRKSFNSNQVHVLRDRVITPKIRWSRVFPTASINYTLDDHHHEADKIYEAKCRVNFDRLVEAYDVCFVEGTNVLGCYEVRDYGGHFRWRSKLIESNLMILENDEDTRYPEFVALIKHLEVNQSTSCQVMVVSKRYPIRFRSLPVRVLAAKKPEVVVERIQEAPEPPMGTTGSVKVNITIQKDWRTKDDYRYTCEVIFLGGYITHRQINIEREKAQILLENDYYRYLYPIESEPNLAKPLRDTNPSLSFRGDYEMIVGRFIKIKEASRCKVVLTNGKTVYSEYKDTVDPPPTSPEQWFLP